jgi:hypothetical protein
LLEGVNEIGMSYLLLMVFMIYFSLAILNP